MDSWVGKIPWRRDRLLSPRLVAFSGGSDGKEPACNVGDLGSVPVCKDPLENRMATHSSILAWRIPKTEKPVSLQFMWSQRVGHD